MFTKCLPVRYLVLTTACPVPRVPLTVISSIRFPIRRVPPAIAFPFLFLASASRTIRNASGSSWPNDTVVALSVAAVVNAGAVVVASLD